MSPRRIEIVGGGPAGLYAARLLKTARPQWQVTVHERMRGSGETFGFGVVLTGSTMTNLTDADPGSAAELRAASHTGHALRLVRESEGVTIHGARNRAIGRATLLEVLSRHAAAAGVDIRSGEHVDAASLDADVVIAADGVHSATREKLAAALGAEVQVGRGLYLWCGADFALTDSIFAPARTDHGMFVAHAYPYASDRSTFLIETDDDTWRRAGMFASDRQTEPGESDDYSLHYLQRAFSSHLGEHRLLGNRSRWLRFHTIHLARWSVDNTVLIGDAAHTAHYTLGSGTKLAMEDAIALTRTLLDHDDVAAAFAAYEQSRRAGVERFQHLAARSQRWWESFPQRSAQPLPTMALGFLTRAGNIGIDALLEHSAEPTGAALEAYGATRAVPLAADAVSWVLEQPVSVGSTTFSSRVVDDLAGLGACLRIEWSALDPWCEQADDAVDRVRQSTADLIVLHGHDDRYAAQGRIDLAERIKLQLGRAILVVVPESARVESAGALACGRCDLVHFTN